MRFPLLSAYLKTELARAKRRLQTLEDQRKELISGASSMTERQTERTKHTEAVIRQGLSEDRDEQEVWRAHDSAYVGMVGIMGAEDLEATCEVMLTRLSSDRFLEEPDSVRQRIRTRLGELQSQAKALAESNDHGGASTPSLEPLRKATASCIGCIFNLMQVKVGRRKFQEAVVGRIVLYAAVALAAFVLSSNYVLDPGAQEMPGTFLAWTLLVFGRAARLAVAGMAGAVVAQGTVALKRKPYITTLIGGLAAHQLMVVMGGIVGVGVIHLARAEVILGVLAAKLSSDAQYVESIALALAFIGGLAPSAVARLATRYLETEQDRSGRN